METRSTVRVLFLCTGNSSRSQMAEGWARHLGLDAFSAGTQPADRVHPLAAQVMAEKGIDLSQRYPKHLGQFLGERLDAVVTVCGDAEERCPAFPGNVHREHWPLPDPAKAMGKPEEVLAFFRTVRDEVERRVRGLVERFPKRSDDTCCATNAP